MPKTYCMKRTSVYIKNMCINSSEVIRVEFLLWLFGCENFFAPSRNGPQTRKGTSHFRTTCNNGTTCKSPFLLHI